MQRLTDAEELLDGPLDDPATLAGNLRDLRRINRLLGGVRLSRRALDRLTDGEQGPVSMLDVGTGGADIPVALLADARRRGRLLEITAVDSRAEVVDAARALRPAIDRVRGLTILVADGRSLPFPDGSYDVVHASMVLHHLAGAPAVELLREMGRVARRGVIVNDLSRGWLHWAGARLLTLVATRNEYTRYDGPLSVRRAWSRPEMRGLLADAGLVPIAEHVGLVGHRYAIVAVAAPATGPA